MPQPDVVPLACFDDGNVDGHPLILVHGFPLHHRMWRAQQRVHPGVRVVAPDLRGFGASPFGNAPLPRGTEGIERMSRDVLALADRLGIERFIAGGWSMGVEVAFMLHRLEPHRVTGLLLASGQPQADSEEQRAKHARNAGRVEELGVAAVEEEMLDAFFLPRTREEHPELVAQTRGWMREASREGIIHALHALRNQPDDRPQLPSIEQPALVIVGRHDRMTPPESSMVAARGLPNARLHVVEESAHLTPLERAEAFNAALREWLDEVLPRVRPTS